ncbi:MAG: ArnT family glycosyltransferase [Candidatus Hodarchaeales archaeon]|jgi:4-amino-4-deoxy-L-arabinose transferase-like glycosyltransferase
MIKNLTTGYDSLAITIRKWITNNKIEFALLLSILLIGAFFRLYKISEYMTFLGDEGRDAIVVRRLLVEFDPILIGPGTSIGNMYLGPIYYYMIAPFLLLFNFSPVGPAVMIALLGVATIFFVWYFTRMLFTFKGGTLKGVAIGALVAAGLYAIAPVVIIYSSSSWNPNIMPFFAILIIYSIWKFWYEKNYKWIIVALLALAFVLQSHYLGLLLAPVIGLFWLLAALVFIRKLKTKSQKLKVKKDNFIKQSIIGSAIFLLLMSPLVIFDSRHGWRNFEAMKVFFTQRQTTVSARPWSAMPKLWPLFDQYSERILTGKNSEVGVVTSLFIVSALLWLLVSKYRDFEKKKLKAYLLVIVWLSVAFIGFGVYKQHIYDHYFGFVYPAGFILIGALVSELIGVFDKYGKILLGTLILVVVLVNLKENPLRYKPNRQMQRAIAVADKIEEKAHESPLNLAVVAERNYEDGYQYFLEKEGVRVIEIDPQRHDETVAEQLFVVCEYEDKNKCDPTHNPKAQVANFGWSKIESEWEIEGVILYKLVHVD